MYFKESLNNQKSVSGSRDGARKEHLMNLTSAFAKAHKKKIEGQNDRKLGNNNNNAKL